jgi:hypothetical protein
VADVGDLPDGEGDAEAPAGPDLVHDLAPGQIGHGVGKLEIEDEVGVVGLVPAELLGGSAFSRPIV